MYYLHQMNAYLINRTPHDVNVVVDGEIITIPKHGDPIRLTDRRDPVGPMLDRIAYDTPVLPDPVISPDGKPVFYIVSNPVAQAAAALGRNDFIAPDTANAVRDNAGKPVAVPGFITF